MHDAEIRRLALACFLPGFVGETPPDWLLAGLDAGLGGVILFGSNLAGEPAGPAEPADKADPVELADPVQLAELTGTLRAAAGRPLVFGLDEEGGDVTRLDARRGSAVPGAAALGWLADEAATEQVYASIGARLAAAGVTLNLAPVADVNSDPRNPVIGVRSFGDSPAAVAGQVAAAVRGIQRAGVAACAKHFPGHGATRADSHHQVARVDRSAVELAEVELPPFQAAIAAGCRAVMTGHLLVPALDRELATVSTAVTTGLLRESLGFDGTIVTDALEMRAISQTVGMVEGFVRALIAGADAIETGAQDYPELITELPAAVLAAVRAGRLSLDRLVDAAARTARLAAAGDPAVHLDRQLLAGVAARCVELRGELPTLVRPLVVECRTANGMATGELAWSLAELLVARLPGARPLVLDGPIEPARLRSAAAGRSLVTVIRDPARNEWQWPVIQASADHQAAAGNAVLVDVGWPAELADLPAGLPLIRTRGIAPGLLSAAADLLVG